MKSLGIAWLVHLPLQTRPLFFKDYPYKLTSALIFYFKKIKYIFYIFIYKRFKEIFLIFSSNLLLIPFFNLPPYS